MSKITKLRTNNRKNGSFLNYIYVMQTDYDLEPVSRTEVEIYFKPEFWEYYGVMSCAIINDKIFSGNTGEKLNKTQLLEGYNCEKIRSIIRDHFKSHILSYIEEQNKISASETGFKSIKRQQKILEKESELKMLKENITNEAREDNYISTRDKIKGEAMKGKDDKDMDFPDLFNFDEVAETAEVDDFNFDDKDDFLFDTSPSPSIPDTEIIDRLESLFDKQIEPSSLIVEYITEASAKFKYLTYEKETKQKIADLEKEIQSLKSLLKLNTEIIKETNIKLKDIKRKTK